jgi:signal transduction histidine kinase/putative methionine-R-sulfoxide reductase with GAF domain
MATRVAKAVELERLKAACEERVRRLEATIEKRQAELTVLSEVASGVHDEDDVQAILDIALDRILDGLGLQAAWVFLGDEKEKRLRLAAHRGVASVYLEDVRTHGLGECLCPEVFWTGHRMQVRNTTECPRMPTIVDGLAEPVAHACVPLAFEGTRRGVLNVAARPGEVFSDDELTFLETVGRQVCLAVERASHLQAERVYNREARALAALNKGIGESLDPEAVLRAVGDTALEVLGVDRVHILLGSDAHSLQVAHLAGLPQPDLREGQVLDLAGLGASLQRRALEEQQHFQVDDWRHDERVNEDLARSWDVAAGLILPLVARKVTLGLLVLTRVTPHHWTADQVDVAEALASQASVALENARLYEKVVRAYRELNEAQARIIQNEKMAVVGTFAAGLAHEVRNPLNSIALQLSILERRVAPLEANLSGELKELIGVIREEVKRLDNLVGDFLQFSGTNRIQYRLTNVDALIDDVLQLLRPEARAAGVTLKREKAGAPPPDLRVDAEKIKQVVINLVQNAIEAMPGGGAVTVESGLRDGRVRVAVRDRGPGLPEGLDVFQLFVTTKARGTGLGLSIAQQIVLEHGGEIAAESTPGHGATFTVTLPSATAGGETELS